MLTFSRLLAPKAEFLDWSWICGLGSLSLFLSSIKYSCHMFRKSWFWKITSEPSEVQGIVCYTWNIWWEADHVCSCLLVWRKHDLTDSDEYILCGYIKQLSAHWLRYILLLLLLLFMTSLLLTCFWQTLNSITEEIIRWGESTIFE